MSPEQHAIETMWRWWSRVSPAITAPRETRSFDQVLRGNDNLTWTAERVNR